MASSVRLDFNLQALLEELSQDELSQFKSLIRTITLGNGLQKIPQTEMATLQVLEKMHRADLCERVKEELRGKEDRHRSILKMKLKQMWEAWPGDSKEVQAVAQRYTTLIPFSNPRMLPGPFPHTVVLHGPAGLGKTTLAKKLMLDWTEDNLSHKFKYAFYLSCKKLSRLGLCSFAELVFRDWPELQDDIPNILAEAQKILFVVDGLDELGAPPGALIHDICGDWLKPKPVPVLLGSLLKRKMLPKAALLVTTRSWALRDLRPLMEQPIFIRVEGFLEKDRRAYFLRHFGDEDQAVELLCCDIICDEDRYSTLTDLKEVLHCLYESQEEELVKGAMAPLKEISLHLSAADVVPSSFCIKHCRNLEKMSLQLIKAKLPENVTASESDAEVERSQDDQHMLPFWTDLCSIFGSNKDLIILEINNSFLSASLLRILCEQIASDACHLQRVVITNISPADAYRNLCLALQGHKTVTHLRLGGSAQNDTLPALCEVLRHPKCNLQYLGLVSCSATTQQWADLSLALEVNRSLTCVNVSNSELLDEGAKLLYTTLKHPKCLLQRLSLENCHLTEANCKDLAAILVVSRELMHLCLAENPLGDTGVKFLCGGLSYPDCKLQTLVLWNCDITSNGCCHLAKLLHEKSSLTNLDLGRNDIGVPGVRGLCEALKKPLCNLKRLWLWGCSIPPASCENLCCVLSCNQTLITLDLGENSLGYSGVKLLFETLTRANGTLQTLRLKIDDVTDELDTLLKEIEGSNPQLTIATENQEPWKKRPSSGYFIV
uniref:NLR family pyrin domain containing 2 n=1 Tax=Saimiri boliviensis boliviensis TaxID=39432 RepID=A0A2K6TCD8_SAIBB